MPTVLRSNPKSPDINPLVTEPNVTDAMAVRPRRAVRKYSAGPNQRETCANGFERNNKTRPLIIPPITEAKGDILIASTARPRLVIRYPSIADAADADVPGVLSKIAEKEPP